jgi:heterodisulfide reductase subunit C
LYLGELLGLAFGLEEQLKPGFDQHRISVAPFLAKWQKLREGRDEAYERFDLPTIETCLRCRACGDICAPHLTDPNFDPHALLEKVRDGHLEEAIADPHVWTCTECYECVERCFQNFGMLKALRELKQLSMERGTAPAAVKAGVEAFRKTGALTKAAKGPRQKLGLPEPPEGGVKELRKLLRDREKGEPTEPQVHLDLNGKGVGAVTRPRRG